MTIQYESTVIGEIRAGNVTASPGVGGFLLRFTANWQLHPKRQHTHTIFGTYFAVSVSPANSQQFRFLGHALPETAWCDESREATLFDTPLMYQLPLSAENVLALEHIRQGFGLTFKVEVRGNANGPNGLRQIYETLYFAVPQAHWLDLLRQVNVADVLLVGVSLPVAEHGTEIAAAVALVKRAHGFLLRGEYDAAVAECRRALESLWSGRGLAEQARGARKVLGSPLEERRSMSKLDRQLALGEAVMHFAHPAHHVDEKGDPEVFSRLDAALAVAAAAALISSLAGLRR